MEHPSKFVQPTSANQRKHIFLNPVSNKTKRNHACLLSLSRGCMFSRTLQRMHVSPRLAEVACFPTTSRDYIFSRDWQRLHVFARYDTSCILAIQLLKKQMTQNVGSPVIEIPFREKHSFCLTLEFIKKTYYIECL